MRIRRRQVQLLRKRDVCFAGGITPETLSALLPGEELKKLEELEKKKADIKRMLEARHLKVPTVKELEAYIRWRDEKGKQQRHKVQQYAAVTALGSNGGVVVNRRPQPEVKWAGTVEVCVKGAAPAQLTSAEIHAIGIEAAPVPDGALMRTGGIVGTSGRPHMSMAVLQGEKIPFCMEPSETVRTVAVHTFNNYVLRYPYVIPEIGILSFRDPKDLNKMVQLTALLGLFKESDDDNYIICAQSTVSFHKGPLSDQKMTTFIMTHKCAWARTKAIEELRYTPQGQMFARNEAFLVFIQLEPASLPPQAPPPHQLPPAPLANALPYYCQPMMTSVPEAMTTPHHPLPLTDASQYHQYLHMNMSASATAIAASAPTAAKWASAAAAGHQSPACMDLVPWGTWVNNPPAQPSLTAAAEEVALLPDGFPPLLPIESPQPPLPEDDDDRPPLPRPEPPELFAAGITRHHQDLPLQQPQQQTSHGRERKQHRQRQQSLPLSQPRQHEASERGPRRGLRQHHEKVHMDGSNLQRLRDHFITWIEEAEDRMMYCCDAPRQLIDELKRLPSGGIKVSEFARAYMSDEVLVERDGRGEKHCVRRNKKEDQPLLDGDSDFSDDGGFDYHY
ncbi:hypothetical protein Vretimale_736 [Volvox reticuliferus]|nr:hypothetical protein Vretimale_736 [Volvox reticuliferus]